MNSSTIKISEKEDVLIETLRLKEKGVPLQEIISLFPDSERDIRDFFETENAVSTYLNSIIPSPDTLFSILDILPTETEKRNPEKEGVTNKFSYRYNDIFDEAKGRFKFKEVSNFMLKKFLVPGVVVILVVIGLVALRNQLKIVDKVTVEKPGQTAPEGIDVVIPPGNDDSKIFPPSQPTAIAEAIITLATNEQSEISGYDDEALLGSDSQEIAELNTIYDETDFQ